MSGYAAVDCGTNSIRLLVTDEYGGSLVRRMEITRLGQGVDRTGQLDPDAIERTIATLRRFSADIEEHGVEAVAVTATSAARDAANRAEFFARVRDALGVEPELLTGEEEARLSFAGATAELDPSLGPFLVIDIGGGSTEFAFGAESCEAAISLDIGCVRLTERFIEHDPPRPEELSAMLSLVATYFEDVRLAIPDAASAPTFVGLAGTITTAAAVEIGLATYDRDRIHHFRLTADATEDVFRTLATESRAERLGNPGLPEGRADVIVGGLSILVASFRHFGFPDCLVSESDILDGLVARLRRSRRADAPG